MTKKEYKTLYTSLGYTEEQAEEHREDIENTFAYSNYELKCAFNKVGIAIKSAIGAFAISCIKAAEEYEEIKERYK
jgi:hypothetical protein